MIVDFIVDLDCHAYSKCATVISYQPREDQELYHTLVEELIEYIHKVVKDSLDCNGHIESWKADGDVKYELVIRDLRVDDWVELKNVFNNPEVRKFNDIIAINIIDDQ